MKSSEASLQAWESITSSQHSPLLFSALSMFHYFQPLPLLKSSKESQIETLPNNHPYLKIKRRSWKRAIKVKFQPEIFCSYTSMQSYWEWPHQLWRKASCVQCQGNQWSNTCCYNISTWKLQLSFSGRMLSHVSSQVQSRSQAKHQLSTRKPHRAKTKQQESKGQKK